MKAELLFERLAGDAAPTRGPRALHETVESVAPVASERVRPMFAAPVERPSAAQTESLEAARRALEEERAGLADASRAQLETERRALAEQYAAGLTRLEAAVAGASRLLAEEVVDLALAVTRELVGHELRAERGPLLSAVEAALARVPSAEEVAVRLHPEDEAYVTEHRPDLASGAVRLIGDPAVGVGGFRLESPRRTIDATMKTRVEAVREALVALVADEQRVQEEEGGDA